jgi:tRNA modification GTPase
LREVRGRLVEVLARIEAAIDFSDEDLDSLDRAAAAEDLRVLLCSLDSLLATALVGRALDQGVRTAIAGRPNVGKSSLLNALLMRERAIVSEIPGTTRDTVEVLVEVGGVPLHLVDTAGIRESRDVIEKLGIERSRLAVETADLTLAVMDASAPLDIEDMRLLADLDRNRLVVVGNKIDLAPGDQSERFEAQVRTHLGGLPDELGEADWDQPWRVVLVSAKTGEGLDELRQAISDTVVGENALQLEEPILANERQRRLVEDARTAVAAALTGLELVTPEELVCEDLREGVWSLGRVTGEELVPDLLDEIFRRFCIGK